MLALITQHWTAETGNPLYISLNYNSITFNINIKGSDG